MEGDCPDWDYWYCRDHKLYPHTNYTYIIETFCTLSGLYEAEGDRLGLETDITEILENCKKVAEKFLVF